MTAEEVRRAFVAWYLAIEAGIVCGGDRGPDAVRRQADAYAVGTKASAEAMDAVGRWFDWQEVGRSEASDRPRPTAGGPA